jgi:hypothetical protein
MVITTKHSYSAVQIVRSLKDTNIVPQIFILYGNNMAMTRRNNSTGTDICIRCVIASHLMYSKKKNNAQPSSNPSLSVNNLTTSSNSILLDTYVPAPRGSRLGLCCLPPAHGVCISDILTVNICFRSRFAKV